MDQSFLALQRGLPRPHCNHYYPFRRFLRADCCTIFQL